MCIQNGSNIFTFEPLANKKRLAEEVQIAMFGDLAKEGNSPSGNGQRLVWDEIVERQFAKFGSSAMLDGGQAAQAGLPVLRIDRLLQALQFAFERAELRIVPLE